MRLVDSVILTFLYRSGKSGVVMQGFDKSSWLLAVIIAVSTAAGGLISTGAGALLTSANTQQETNVQLIQLAIGILSKPLPEREGKGPRDGTHPEDALREWAVSTINNSAEIKFDEDASELLVKGTANLPNYSPVDPNTLKLLDYYIQNPRPTRPDPFIIEPEYPFSPAPKGGIWDKEK